MQEPTKGRVHWGVLILASIFFLCAGTALGMYVLPELFDTANPADGPAPTATVQPTQVPEDPDAPTPQETETPVATPQTSLSSAKAASVTVTAQFGKSVRTGSGVIVQQDGKIVTSTQLIDRASGVTVTLDGQTQALAAKVIASDTVSDLALLSVDKSDLPTVTFGASGSVQLGDAVFAIGTPAAAYPNTLSQGIVSGLARQVDVRGQLQTFLQTDAALADGSLGGGLFNAQGACIGIVSYKEHRDGYDAQGNLQAAEGIALALPSDVVRPLIDAMLDGKAVQRPTLQLTAVTLSAEKAAALGLTGGVYVQRVQQGGAAHLAGLQAGDVITAIGGTSVSTLEQLQSMVAMFQVDEDVVLDVRRDDQALQLAVRIANDGAPAATAAPTATPSASPTPSASAAPSPTATPKPADTFAPTASPAATADVRDARIVRPVLSLLRGRMLWI